MWRPSSRALVSTLGSSRFALSFALLGRIGGNVGVRKDREQAAGIVEGILDADLD
jgi:hypothetical protein